MKNFSSLLKDSFIFCKKNFIFFVSVIFLSGVPGLILLNLENANVVAYWGTIQVISWFLPGILGHIALVVAIQNLKQGQHSSIASVYRQAIKLFLPVLVVLIIEALIVLGGFVLLVAPGILFSIWYLFSLYAAVIHKKRKSEALALSKAVVRTSTGKVIGYILLIGIMGYGPSILFSSIIEKGVFPSFLPYLLVTIIQGGIGSILTVWVTAFLFMFYIDLIEANPQILKCFELEGMEYEKTEYL